MTPLPLNDPGAQVLELSVHLPEVTRAVGWLESILEAEGLDPARIFGFTLSLDEVLTNIIDYGFPATEPDAQQADAALIRLIFRRDAEKLTLEVQDCGIAFDPTNQQIEATVSDVAEAPIGGHGLRLMRHYLDSLEYQRRDGWNTLRLTMRAA